MLIYSKLLGGFLQVTGRLIKNAFIKKTYSKESPRNYYKDRRN